MNGEKYYWAYESSCVENKIFIFHTYDECLDHAIKHGEFDEISCKEYMMAHEENLLFEISEEEVTELSKYWRCPKCLNIHPKNSKC
jgi:hypothetical protein